MLKPALAKPVQCIQKKTAGTTFFTYLQQDLNLPNLFAGFSFIYLPGGYITTTLWILEDLCALKKTNENSDLKHLNSSVLRTF